MIPHDKTIQGFAALLPDEAAYQKEMQDDQDDQDEYGDEYESEEESDPEDKDDVE